MHCTQVCQICFYTKRKLSCVTNILAISMTITTIMLTVLHPAKQFKFLSAQLSGTMIWRVELTQNNVIMLIFTGIGWEIRWCQFCDSIEYIHNIGKSSHYQGNHLTEFNQPLTFLRSQKCSGTFLQTVSSLSYPHSFFKPAISGTHTGRYTVNPHYKDHQ